MTANLWMMGIRACIPILFVLAARALLWRYPSSWRYCLWMLVLFRLLCPLFIESGHALQPDLRQYWEESDDAGQTADGNAVQAKPDGGARAEAAEKPDMPKDRLSLDTIGLLQLVYIVGALAVTAVFLWQYVRMRRRIRFAVRDSENIWLCENIASPFVMGIFRPRIYLPYGLQGKERGFTLMHERTHIRHLDPLFRFLGLIAVCLHWWNPLVWYAYRAACEDMEMYCDESVMRDRALEEKKAYANTLLSMSARHSGLAVFPAFGRSGTEKRVRSLLLKKESRGEVLFVSFFLLMLAMGICINLMLTVHRREAGALDMSAYGEEDMPVPLTETVMAEASVVSDENRYQVQLVMTEGEYFSEEYTGAGGGIYEENFRGGV